MTSRAKVKRLTGSTKHYLGSILEGRPVPLSFPFLHM